MSGALDNASALVLFAPMCKMSQKVDMHRRVRPREFIWIKTWGLTHCRKQNLRA